MSSKNILLIHFLVCLALQTNAQTAWSKQHEAISHKAYKEGNKNKADLIATNKWPYQTVSPVVYFRNPIAAMPGMYDYGFYHVPYGVDLFPGQGIKDWACTYNETYTRTFEDCTGTVFEIVPKGYQPMINNVATVVAAADGIIVAKYDGYSDQRCFSPSPPPANESNYVVLEHSDGSRTYYYDLKNGGQTSKPVGSYIAEQEFIG